MSTEKNRLSLIGSSSPPSRSLFPWTDTPPPNLLQQPCFLVARVPPHSCCLHYEREREDVGDAIDPPFPHCQVFSLSLGYVGHRRLSFFGDLAENDSRSRPIRKQDNFFIFPSAAVEALGSVWFWLRRRQLLGSGALFIPFHLRDLIDPLPAAS